MSFSVSYGYIKQPYSGQGSIEMFWLLAKTVTKYLVNLQVFHIKNVKTYCIISKTVIVDYGKRGSPNTEITTIDLGSEV